jgi:transcriptional regulator with XRE-family HTH domain
MTNDEKIGKHIRSARLDMGYTLDVLAAHLDLNLDAISKKERGVTSVTAEQLVKLARLLERPVTYFLEGVK